MGKIQIALLVFLILVGSMAIAQTKVAIENHIEISSSADHGGSLARPRICPVEPSWVAYEVRSQENVELWVVNTETNEKRQINVADDADEFDGGATGANVTRDLAWAPVKGRGGSIWAAFISNAAGNDDLYIYNLNMDSAYQLTMEGADKGRVVSEPSWSPDGYCLTYTSTLNNNADIYIIRGMEWVLRNPRNKDISFKHSALITGAGNQFGASWCSIAGAGYIAYTDQQSAKNKRLRVRIWDPRPQPGVAYDLGQASGDLNYFSPVWSESGKVIAFYVEEGGQSSTGSASSKSTLNLGFAEVKEVRDKIVFVQKSGGLRGSNTVLRLAPNDTKFQGPVWLKGGSIVAVPEYLEEDQNPLKFVKFSSWSILGQRKNRWLFSTEGRSYSFPRDVNSVGNQITFTYGGAMKRNLMIGSIGKSIFLDPPKSYLTITKDRAKWYSEWAKDKHPGFLSGLWGWANTPLFGPDIGINKGGILAAAGIGIAAYLILGGDDDIIVDPLSRRNWGLPKFPS